MVALIIDITMLCLLAVTIFYAVRLSQGLDVFRRGKADMERLLRDLNIQTLRAQEAITTLEKAAGDAGDDLRQTVAKARGLSDELQLMSEAGNSLAERLESIATRNRTIAEGLERAALGSVNPGTSLAATPRAPQGLAPASTGPGFAIRDPDYDIDDDTAANNEPLWADDDDDGLQSRAEKDLADALRRRRSGTP